MRAPQRQHVHGHRFLAASRLVLLLALCGCSEHPESHSKTEVPPAAAEDDGHSHAEQGHEHGLAADRTGSNEDSTRAEEIVLSANAVQRYGLSTDVVRRHALRPTVVVPARVGFNTEAMAHVGSPLRGRVSDVRVRVGDGVTTGQVLAVVESPELGEAQAEYLQRRVAVQTAEPAVDLSRVAWERAKALFDRSQGISLTEVQRREAEHKAAIAGLKAAESARTAAANRLRLLGMEQAAIEQLASTGEVMPDYSIRAAIDGVVVQREVTLGELVSPDRAYLMVIADPTILWVLADVSESHMMGIRPGAKAWVSIGSGGGADAPRFEGMVAFLSTIVDPTTRTAQVRIEVPGTALGLRPGMFAQAEIETAHPGDAASEPILAVPESAIQTVEGKPSVFVPVANEPGAYRLRAVTVGDAVGGLVPILSGLREGETFVRAGTFILKAELGKGAAAHAH